MKVKINTNKWRDWEYTELQETAIEHNVIVFISKKGILSRDNSYVELDGKDEDVRYVMNAHKLVPQS